MEWKLSKQEKRRLEKRSPFYATFDYKFSHRRWWHFMLLLLLKILMLWHKVTAPTKNPAPPSWEKWDGSWKIEYNFYRNSLMCAVILSKLCPLGNMLDVAFKLNWNCPPRVSIKPKSNKSNKTQNLWGFGKERFWVFNIWKIQNLIKQIDSENVENPKTNFLKDWCRIFNLWKTQNLKITQANPRLTLRFANIFNNYLT